MDSRWVPIPLDSKQDARVILHPTATFAEIRSGTAADGFDLTEFVSAGSHGMFDCSITLNWNMELFGDHQPRPNQLLEIQLYNNGSFSTVWIGIIESLNGLTLSRGERSMQLIARNRASTDIWRTTKRVTELFPQMTDITYIARKIALAVGLDEEEIWIPTGSIYTAHTNTQLADMSAWDMLSSLFLPLGWTPFIDTMGQLRAAGRSIAGVQPTILLTADRIKKVTGQKQRPPVTRVNLHWLDPVLKKSRQQGRKLADAIMTTGWFLPFLKKTIWFSADKTQRAEKTYMVIKQSANNLFVKVCSEKYKQKFQNEGEITLTNYAWGPTIGLLVGQWFAAHSSPDHVIVPPGGGDIPVIPTGRRVEAAFQLALMLILLSIGTGIYEIWGTPFDWIHARNTTVAFDENAAPWADNPTDVDSDFIMNEQHAQAVAVRELIYSSRASNKFSIQIVDDPRIEFGDILQFPDQSLMYVEDYTRTITRGSEATLEVRGFLIGVVKAPVVSEVQVPQAPVLDDGGIAGGEGGDQSGSEEPVVDNTASGGTTGVNVSGPVSLPTLPNAGTGNVVTVSAFDDLQAAIDAAQPGDTLLLEAGAVFTGNFTLPNKTTGTAGITIKSAGTLPAENVRVSPASAANFATIQSGNSQTALATDAGAHDYSLIGLKLGPNSGGFGDILTLGSGASDQDALSKVPQRILVDRCYFYGDPSTGQKRGIGLNSGHTTIKNCYIEDIFISGQDSQAIGGWNGPGPYYITNNYLEAASENILFGGADPQIANLIPSDITITKNHFSKKLAWMGAGYVVKNAFELKNGRRCLVRGNVFEYSWVDGQAGNLIVLTPRNQDGDAPWCTVEDVNIEYNLLRHAGGGFNLAGHDNVNPNPVTMKKIRIANNLVYDIDSDDFNGNGSLFTMTQGPIDQMAWDHNTFIQSNDITNMDHCQLTNYKVTNNLFVEGTFGWFTADHASGKDSLDAAAPGYVWTNNVVGGAGSVIYPTGTQKPDRATFDANFTDPENGDFSLVDNSVFGEGGSDGKDIGCDIAKLNTEIAGVV